jgi:hypothetical protein
LPTQVFGALCLAAVTPALPDRRGEDSASAPVKNGTEAVWALLFVGCSV